MRIQRRQRRASKERTIARITSDESEDIQLVNRVLITYIGGCTHAAIFRTNRYTSIATSTHSHPLQEQH